MDNTEVKSFKAYFSPCEGSLKFNYYYFGILFFFITLVHVVHVLVIEQGTYHTKCFFVGYAILQCFLEVLGLVILEGVVSTYLPRFLTPTYIVLTFLLFLSHLIDFPLVRIMDMSIWYVLGFLPQESPQNFLEMLYASGVSISTWITAALVSLIFLFSSVGFFQFTERKILERPLPLSYRSAVTTLCLGFLFLFAWDFSGTYLSLIHKDPFHQKALPWKSTFFAPKNQFVALISPLKDLQHKKELLLPALSIDKKPPIFLIVAESLREDFMTKEVAPNLHQFKSENLSFDLALSNANATQMSWFSIFHSKLPFYWSTMKKEEKKKGSLPLQLLKELGYKINVFSSSGLTYYGMDELIFGKDCALLDSLHYFPHDDENAVHESDANNIKEIGKWIKNAESLDGNLFIIFLESTHFNYSWPKETRTAFKPFLENINYLKIAVSKDDLEKIKNSYRNAVHYIDSLFGTLQKNLKAHDLWKEAVVIMTGDHGEEFYENGHLFHTSHLSKWQTHVPLYYKLGNTEEIKDKISTKMTSHLDIFPTLLHYLQGDAFVSETYHGNSVLMPTPFPFVVSARYNASRTPYEFFIHNGKYKMLARFSNEQQIFKSKDLKILSVFNDKDEKMNYSPLFIQEHFQDALDTLFPLN